MEDKFFKTFFKPVYRFYYCTSDIDMISGHSDGTVRHIDFKTECCKFTFEEIQKGIKDGHHMSINGIDYKCHNVEIYQPIFKITPQIMLKLEDIALNNDFILTKVPHPNDPLEDDLYKWVDSTNLNKKIYSTADKSRKDSVLNLLINIKEDVHDEVRGVFNVK